MSCNTVRRLMPARPRIIRQGFIGAVIEFLEGTHCSANGNGSTIPGRVMASTVNRA